MDDLDRIIYQNPKYIQLTNFIHENFQLKSTSWFDELLGYMMDIYVPMGIPTPLETKEYWRKSQLREILPTVVPVTAAKTIIGEYKIPVQTAAMKNWKLFVATYSGSLPSN